MFGNMLWDLKFEKENEFAIVVFRNCIRISNFTLIMGMIILTLGIYSFMKQKKHVTSKYYLLISLFCSLWEAGASLINISLDFQNRFALIMFIFSSVIILPVSIIYMFHRAEFSQKLINGFIAFLIVLTTFLLCFIIFVYHPKYELKSWGMSIIFPHDVIWQVMILLVFEIICGVVFIAGCFYWAAKTHLKRVRAQIKSFICYVVLLLMGFMVSIILPCVLGKASNPFGSIFVLLAFLILTYSLHKARAFDVSIEIMSEDFIDLVKMPFIVIDGEDNILLANKSAEALFGITLSNSKGLDWVNLFEEDFSSFKRGITKNVTIKRGHIPVKLSTTIVRDNYGDIFYSLTYVTDMTKERNLVNQLKASQEEAISANKAKGDFLANMSHEIRTPINAVLGLDEMIIRESNETEIRDYAIDIKGAAKTLLGLVNEILDFSKIESGKLEIIPVQYELSSVINDIYNMLAERASEKHLSLELEIDPEMPHELVGDEIRIKQIILNIANNAVKYTAEGYVKINLSSKKDDENHIMMLVSVSDSGIGIKEEDIDKLLTPFTRVDEQKNRSIEGTGLGLSITNSLLQLMNSKLDVESEYGKGTVFSFAVRQKVTSWDPIGDIAKRHAEIHNLEGIYKESYYAPDAKILVVDDNHVNLIVIKGLLKKTQIQIDTADSGKECLELVQQNKYHVILLDHMMPEMDGIEVCHILKEKSHNINYETPVIALTANAVSGAREMYLREGFVDYISKPVDGIALEERLRKYIPKELLLVPEENEVEEVVIQEKHPEEQQTEQKETGKKAELNIKQGIENCGGYEEVYNEAAKEFYITIESRAKVIEEAWKNHDIKNYTIEVHGLKSSSRLIGALKLSKLAEYLEICGKQEKTDEIDDKTEELLTLYRSYEKELEKILTLPNQEKYKTIDGEYLKEVIATLLEFVEAYDFDNADMVMKELEQWKMPKDFENTYQELKVRMAEVDRDGIIALMNK